MWYLQISIMLLGAKEVGSYPSFSDIAGTKSAVELTHFFSGTLCSLVILQWAGLQSLNLSMR
jgi:hypothetical protein